VLTTSCRAEIAAQLRESIQFATGGEEFHLREKHSKTQKEEGAGGRVEAALFSSKDTGTASNEACRGHVVEKEFSTSQVGEKKKGSRSEGPGSVLGRRRRCKNLSLSKKKTNNRRKLTPVRQGKKTRLHQVVEDSKQAVGGRGRRLGGGANSSQFKGGGEVS